MQKTCLSVLALVIGLAGGANAQTIVSGAITTDTTWGGASNPCPIIMEQPVFVKSGARLTILPGCIVRGQPRTAAVAPNVTAGTPGTLIVTQSGSIVAEGSANSPIIFTTAAVDNDANGVPDDVNPADGFLDAWQQGDRFLDNTPVSAPLAPLNTAGGANVSLWGGLAVLGNAPTNLDDGCGIPNPFTGIGLAKGLCTVEGLTVPGFPVADATYGGILPHDSSGSLKFISVRHAGDEIGNGNELNGVTLAGVGDGTTFENVEVYANFDDGIEWFGGTVNGRNLIVSFAGDDVFDVDQGYTGINQFLLGIMPFFNQNSGAAYGSASGDKGGEWDGDDFLEVGGVCTLADGTCRPFSNPQFCNVTILGSTPDSGAAGDGNDFTPVSAAGANRGIQMRHGFAGELANSIVVNTGSQKGFTVDSGTGEACPGFDTTDNVATCSTQVLASTFDDGNGALSTDEFAALACGDTDPRTAAGTGANVVNSASFPQLEDEDTTFDPTGNAAGKLVSSLKGSPIDPRPAFGLSGVAGGISTCPNPAATYRGAFDPSAPTLWTDGWTALSSAGLL